MTEKSFISRYLPANLGSYTAHHLPVCRLPSMSSEVCFSFACLPSAWGTADMVRLRIGAVELLSPSEEI